jgi:hypothetical protein
MFLNIPQPNPGARATYKLRNNYRYNLVFTTFFNINNRKLFLNLFSLLLSLSLFNSSYCFFVVISLCISFLCLSQTKSNLDEERIGANKEVKKERVTKFGSAKKFWAICSLFEGKGLNKKER